MVIVLSSVSLSRVITRSTGTIGYAMMFFPRWRSTCRANMVFAATATMLRFPGAIQLIAPYSIHVPVGGDLNVKGFGLFANDQWEQCYVIDFGDYNATKPTVFGIR